jgi:hypothetical protein
MNLSSENPPGKGPQGDGASSVVDPRLQPTPDFGTLGPGSDIPVSGTDPIQRTPVKARPMLGPLLAMAVGMFAAVLFGTSHNPSGLFPSLGNLFSSGPKESVSGKEPRPVDGLEPQRQAETLLEQAVAHAPGAVDQISSRVDRWQGQVQWNSQIANLTTAALNSNDMRVRESGVEVELAAYGLSKNSQSLDHLLETADSPDHAQKIWALWALGLMANRGVESARVVEVLISHLNDSDVESRHWAVEALALAGTDDAIQPLLKSMHDDASPIVRERAACGLAASGMFTSEQRLTTVPQLLNDTDDPSLDAQTHGWAFQALSDITHQRLPRDSAAWRSWYSSTKGESSN